MNFYNEKNSYDLIVDNKGVKQSDSTKTFLNFRNK